VTHQERKLRASIARDLACRNLQGMRVLDFGAGEKLHLTRKLAKRGINVRAFDTPTSLRRIIEKNPRWKKYLHARGKYDLVFASNVVNVQCHPGMLKKTLAQMYDFLKPGGTLIVNVPREPIYLRAPRKQIYSQRDLASLTKKLMEDVGPVVEVREACRGHKFLHLEGKKR